MFFWASFLLVIAPAIIYAASESWQEKVTGLLTLITIAGAVLFALFATLWINQSVTGLILAFFFAVAFPLRYAHVSSNLEAYRFGGFASIGEFDFTQDDFGRLTLVALIGTAGLALGVAIGAVSSRKLGWSKNQVCKIGLNWNLNELILLWVGISVAVSFVCMKLEISQSGISPVALPLKLTGILNHLRSFVLPLAGWLLFGIACQRKQFLAASGIFISAAIIGVFSIYVTLSKAAILYAVLPYLVYIFFRQLHTAFGKRLLLAAGLLLSLILPVSFFGAMVLREEAQTRAVADRRQVFEEYLAAHGVETRNEIDRLLATIGSVFARVTGGSEVMAIVASPPQPRSVLQTIVLGRGSSIESGVPEAFRDVFNVQVGVHDGLYSGKAFGLYGTLFLSHNYIILFMGTTLLAAILFLVERFLAVTMGDATSVSAAFWYTLGIWESGFDIIWPQLALGIVIALVVSRFGMHSVGDFPPRRAGS